MAIFNKRNKNKDDENKIEKEAIKKFINIIKSVATFLFLKLFPIIFAGIMAMVLFDFITNVLVTPKETPKQIYSLLEIEDVKELVEVKGDETNGYYWDFKEGTNEKLEKVIEWSHSHPGMESLPSDVEFMTLLIKAELCNQLPDLGGKIPEGTTGFQGNIKIRRVTPDKEIGKMENTGDENSTVSVEKEIVNYNSDLENSYIDELKKHEKKDKFKIKFDTNLYKETESKIQNSEGTGNFEIMLDSDGKEIELKEGDQVKYTGNYKTAQNPLSELNKIIVYVEVNVDDITGYVKADALIFNKKKSKEANKSNVKLSSRAGDSESEDKTLGKNNKEYTIAIAAGNNDSDDIGARKGDLVEEELTIQVAEKVEELLKEYKNITVKQTGSTSRNTSDVKVSDRTKKARDANPDLCIQIHFGSSSDGSRSGTQVIYKEGDGVSQQLAEFLSESISDSLGVENLGSGTDTQLCGGSILNIENAATSGFPSVLTKGCYIDNDSDGAKIRAGGVTKYAQGIVKGIDKYLKADHTGYVAEEVEEEKTSTSIKSIVRNMKYIESEKFNKLIEDGNIDVLKYFTLDNENKLITATWTYEDGTTKISANSSFDLKTPLQNYVVPYEYLLFYMINTTYAQFSEDLAKQVLDSEIIVAVQDDITTTNEKKTIKTIGDANREDFSYTSTEGGESKISEYCSTSVNITYVDTWCAKVYNENSYGTSILGMEDEDEVKVNIMGKVTDSSTKSSSTETVASAEHRQAMDGEGNRIDYIITVTKETTIETRTISSKYESGDTIQDENGFEKFTKLYLSNKMNERVRTSYLYMVIEDNEKTANMLDMTKYLIYKATGEQTGIYEYDFSIYRESDFQNAGSSASFETFIEYLHAWEGNEGITADGKFYLVGNDGAGHPTVGYGVDIFNSGYLNRFKEAGYTEDQLRKMDGSTKIPVELVDGIEKEEREAMLEKVEEKTAGLNLTIYQKYALVSRAYNCGAGGAFTTRNGKNFRAAYKAYWNQETDDEYNVAANDGMYDHALYKNYMCQPNTSNGEYLRGLENRRKSEWILFKTGYYDRIDKWCSDSSDGIGTVILTGDNKQKMEAMLAEAVRIANDDRYGYSQGSRMSEFYYDCSSFVYRLYKQFFGITVPSTTAGYGETGRLPGKPEQIELQPGDVLWRSGHVTLYLGDGTYAAAHGRNRSIYSQSKANFCV